MGNVFAGSVRDLCPLAPNNVNTMATASIAAHNLGFDGVECCLIADSRLVVLLTFFVMFIFQHK